MLNNQLKQVITYNESGLAKLLNSYALLSNFNKKFKGFNDSVPMNLGDTVSFTKPTRLTTTNSLIAEFQGITQRFQNLTIDKEISSSYQFTSQQFILNVEDYMSEFGSSAVAEIGTVIEADLATVFETNTFRFFGDGVTPISTSAQLANALAFFRNFGAAKTDTKAFLSDLTYPAIINTNLNQFTPDRNNKQAMSWELGEFSRCNWFESNLLTTHLAGSEGNAGTTLTVVSVVKNAAGGIIQITFSGTSAASDANSIKASDKFVFSDGVSGKPNLRYRTFIGHKVSQCPVQFRATADAASTAGSQVTVDIYPALQAASGSEQNLNVEIVAGMQATALPDHRCGGIIAGNPAFLALPKLDTQEPYPTSVAMDPDSGASIRQYYGTLFGQNKKGMVHDAIWGKTLVDEYAMMVALPV